MSLSYHAALAGVVLDNRLGVLVEGDETLLDGSFVIISSARGLCSLQQSLSHGLIRHLEVENVSAGSDGLLKLLSLSNLTRISVNQESLGSTQLLDHGLGQKIQNSCKRHQLTRLHDRSQVLASLRSRSHLLSEQVTRAEVGEAVLCHDLVALSSLATAGSSQHPDNGETRGSER